MKIDEILLFAKILAYVSGDRSVTITGIEMEMAADALKRLADQRFDWTQEQREQFKAMVMCLYLQKGNA